VVVIRLSSMSLSVAFTINESWTVRTGIDLLVSSFSTVSYAVDSFT